MDYIPNAFELSSQGWEHFFHSRPPFKPRLHYSLLRTKFIFLQNHPTRVKSCLSQSHSIEANESITTFKDITRILIPAIVVSLNPNLHKRISMVNLLCLTQFRHFAQGHLMMPSSTRLGIEKARSINLLVFSIQSLDGACVVHPPLFCHCFWFCHKNIIFDTKYFCISINHIKTLVSIDLSNNSTS